MISSRSITVFLVDDSPSVRQRLVQLLESIPGVALAGEAHTAEEAIAGILSSRPDSVIIDLNLRSGSGLGVLKAVHPKLPAIAFIVLTNHSEPQYRRACRDAGAEYFIDKSTEFDQVRGIIAGIASKEH